MSTDRLVDLLWGDQPPATAAHTIQVYVSNLRKALGSDVLVTRAPGYLVAVDEVQLDLTRFESLLHDGRQALAVGDPRAAEQLLREALALWRGPPLADFAYEAFAQAAIGRLDELRLVALDERIEAELQLGGHDRLVAELQTLVAKHPLRERPRGQLMLALYRSGRQAEALEAFQETRRLLVDELGIEPGPALQQLERAILQQDPSLEARTATAAPAADERPERSILIAGSTIEQIDALLGFSAPLAESRHPHELILAVAVQKDIPLREIGTALNDRRAALEEDGVFARAAAFTSSNPSSDLVRLASEQDVDLALIDGHSSLDGDELTDATMSVLAAAPCDVALVFSRPARRGPVVVPFGGGEHDWAAVELGAWCALAGDTKLQLLGTEADDESGRRDASRLLAHAALAVQQLAGVMTEPVLVAGGEDALLDAAEPAGLVVVGVSDRWVESGLGATRRAIVERAPTSVAVVRRGLRPGGLAPRETLTHYTWSMSGAFAGVAATGER